MGTLPFGYSLWFMVGSFCVGVDLFRLVYCVLLKAPFDICAGTFDIDVLVYFLGLNSE